MKANTAKTHLIIHGFALAHALTIILFGMMGLGDDIPLTILTILMIILIARRYDFPLDISAALALVCCFAGFYLGTKGADIIGNLFDHKLESTANVISTLLVTEILGWLTYFIVRKRGKTEK